MEKELQDPDMFVVHVDHAGPHDQRIAGPRLAQEAHVMIAHDERGFGASPKGARQAQTRRQLGQALHGARYVEAHVHVTHLVAFPGGHGSAPDLDARRLF
jgi:hypothetical protein